MDMEKQKVMIDVCNAQTMDGETEKLEMRVVGTICKTDGGFLVEYTEYDDEGRPSEIAVRAIGDSFVSVARAGDCNTEMRFETGKRHSTVYNTPYGALTMGIYTKRVENALTENGGRLHFCYTTDFHAQVSAENRMTLQIELA